MLMHAVYYTCLLGESNDTEHMQWYTTVVLTVIVVKYMSSHSMIHVVVGYVYLRVY